MLKCFFCRHYFSPLTTFIRKGKDPDPEGPKTCGIADAQHCLHGEHELGDVVGVECGGLGGEAGGQVGESDVGNIVVDRHLPGGDRLDVAACLSRQVNNLTYL